MQRKYQEFLSNFFVSVPKNVLAEASFVSLNARIENVCA